MSNATGSLPPRPSGSWPVPAPTVVFVANDSSEAPETAPTVDDDGLGTTADADGFWPRFRRLAFRLGALTVVLWIAVSGYLVYSAQARARDGEAALRVVADVIDSGDVADVDFTELRRNMLVGESALADARSAIESPLLLPWRPFPVVGRQLASAGALITTSNDLTEALLPVVEAGETARNDPNALDRVAFLRDVAAKLRTVEAVIAEADLGPSSNLVGPLFDGRAELAEQLGEVSTKATSYRVITEGLASFLDEGRYVLIGANNAEMMLASGMHLSVGQLSLVDGDFELPGLTPSSELFPVRQADLVDSDVADRWGFLSPTNDWRKLGLSARFDQYTGPQALELWRAQNGELLDGAVSLDPFVLDALLGVVGPVEVQGEVISQGGALAYLLIDQYAEFELDQQSERRDRLSDLASAVVDAFDSNDWDPVDLLQALEPLANGRHILVYSTDLVEQAAWEELGVAGTLDGSEIGVFLLNTGASKLDPFVALSVDATTRPVEGGVGITYRVSVDNRAPSSGLPPYAVGPWPSLGLPSEGTYRGRVAIYVPGSTRSIEFGPNREVVAFGRDGPVLMAATASFTVEPGTSHTVRIDVTVPAELTEVSLLPSTRFPAVEWAWNGEAFDDSERRSIILE